MKLSDMKIAVRLAVLGGFFVVALALVGLAGWMALGSANIAAEQALQRSALLTDAVDTSRNAQVQFKIQVQEWKNILLRGHDADQFEKYSAAFNKSGGATRAELEKSKVQLAQLGLSTALADTALAAHAELEKNYLSALGSFNSSIAETGQEADASAAPAAYKLVDAQVKGMDRLPTKNIDAIVTFVGLESDKLIAAMNVERQKAEREATYTLLGIVLAAALAGAAISLWLARSITVPLAEAVGIARTVAAGDLSTHIQVRGSDEIGVLLQSLKDMHDNLAGIVGKVRVGSDAIASASLQIAHGNQDLSSRTEEQAGSLEETASSLEELTATVKRNGESAGQASRLAGSASSVAVRGGDAVAQVIDTMGAINESSRKIVDIIGVIDGIAFQTNILALNAAVEAARAGEQGRGFAVVASEVRSLAQRSAAAAKEIKTLIGDSVEQVETGSKLVGQAGVTMTEVVTSVQQVTTIISEIAVASGEQNAGIDQINEAVARMDAVTQQNAALVEEAAAAAEAMQQQAASLALAVSVFKIKDSHVVAAPAARASARRAPASAQLKAPRPAAKPAAKPATKPVAAGESEWEEF